VEQALKTIAAVRCAVGSARAAEIPLSGPGWEYAPAVYVSVSGPEPRGGVYVELPPSDLLAARARLAVDGEEIPIPQAKCYR
jgi:hypothetical protein